MGSMITRQHASAATPGVGEKVATTCPYCGVGCGVSVSAAGTVTLSGDATHPANSGRLCVKGSALAETLGLGQRLLHPLMRDAAGDMHRADWPAAIARIANAFQQSIRDHSPDSVAFYVSGQLLTEDYYVANKLMKGFIGSANIDTNSRLCMSSAVAGHKRAFGEDVVPGCYEDFELADLIVLVGSNTAWCHPVLYQRIVAAKAQRPEMRVVVIDPRRTSTSDIADLHLPLRPGSDVVLFNGLLAWLSQQGGVDQDYVAAHTRGFAEALAVALETAGDLAQVARETACDATRLAGFYALFAGTEKVVTLFSQGVNQSIQGTDKVNSIINCHLATGRIGRPGMGPFSMTGQPNAMGGREVGGLSTTLAAHIDFDTPGGATLVQSFWQSPAMPARPGLKAVELFRAVAEGRIKALWIMATNPVVSLPDADQVKAALAACDFVAVSDITRDTDTTAFADVLLPALGWGEKDGTVTNSERCISRQRAFLPAPGEARPDWWALARVAEAMGHGSGFGYHHAHDIFLEHARLSAWRNHSGAEGTPRRFNLEGLCTLDRAGYDALAPQQWPVLLETGSEQDSPKRLFGDGRFAHRDQMARFIATRPVSAGHATDSNWPLVLNTGRIRDQWHTMTRTGLAPTLGGHIAEPFVDLHPADALSHGLREHELARVSTRWGAVVVRVSHRGEVRRGQIFMPIHWNDRVASDARVGRLVNPVVDPISGEPEFKHTPARIEPFTVDWQGVLYTRDAITTDSLLWWAQVQTAAAIRIEFAGRGKVSNRPQWARQLLGAADDADWLEYHDPHDGIYHAALFQDGRLMASLHIAPRELLPDREWLATLFARSRLGEADRISVLAGAPLNPASRSGPLVCSCFRVGRNTLVNTIRDKGLRTPAEVTACLKAGGNCGSCVPEIRELIAHCGAE